MMFHSVVYSVIFLVVYCTSASLGGECSPELELNLEPNQVQGLYMKNGMLTFFEAFSDGSTIDSITIFQGNGADLVTQLSLPNSNGHKVPEMLKRVTKAALELKEQSDCNIPSEALSFYEEFSNTLYGCTDSLGTSQLRFATMYHTSVIGTASRLCDGVELACTPSPSYENDEEMFICIEDLAKTFPDKISGVTHTMSANAQGDCELLFPLGRGLQGGDICCCGNYPGCCVFASDFCCWHDTVCRCCGQWFCGAQCKPESDC